MTQMKTLLLSLSAILLTPLTTTFASPRFGMSDPWSQVNISLPQDQKPLGEMLAVYAKTASANVFADVTGRKSSDQVESPMGFVAPRTQIGRTLGLIRIGFKAQMCYDRSATDTFVLWPRPDLDHLAGLSVAAHKEFDLTHPAPDRAETIAALREFYSHEKGWKAQFQTLDEKDQSAQGVKDAIRLADLPPALRAPVMAELAYRIRRLEPNYPPAWTDDYWKAARVHLFIPTKQQKDRHYATVEIYDPFERFLLGVPSQVKVAALFPVAAHSGVCAPPTDAPKEALPLFAPLEAQNPSGFDFDPTAQAALCKVVSLNFQFVPPAAIVADLKKQTGIALGLAPDVAPAAQTIAISQPQGMPLWSAMAAMARLYSAHWEKAGQGYRLTSDNLDELHALMARTGLYADYNFQEHSRTEALDIGSDLATQIVDEGDRDQLTSPQGLPLSSLSADLQKEVVDLIHQQTEGAPLVSQQRLDNALAQNLELRFAPLPNSAPQFFGANYSGGPDLNGSDGAAVLTVYTTGGRFVVRLFPEFSAPKSSDIDRLLQKRRDEIAKAQAKIDAQEAQDGQPQ